MKYIYIDISKFITPNLQALKFQHEPIIKYKIYLYIRNFLYLIIFQSLIIAHAPKKFHIYVFLNVKHYKK